MTRPRAELLLHHIHRLADRDATAKRSDVELLHRFVGEGEEAAFTSLVQRHGAMVWQVCQSALPQREDAEDVFQATFLVLARRAASVRKPESLASWLHGVALCLARKVRARNLRRGVALADGLDRVPARAMDDLTWRELRQILHEELGRLPEKNRLPILLCHLQGQTQDEAARSLGWTLGRLRGRLLRGRELLRGRLARRGLAPAALAAALLSSETGAGAPPSLVDAVGRTIAALARQEAALTASPMVLAREFIREAALFRTKAALSLAVTLLTLIGVLSAALPGSPPAADERRAELPGLAATARGEESPRKDQLGDPLPTEALFRLGTLRFRSNGVVRALAFTSGGKTLICAGWDRSIRRWEARTGAELKPLDGPEKGFIDAAVSLDGKTLVGGTEAGTVHVWDLTAGKEVRQINLPGKPIRSVAVSSDGRSALAAGDDNAVRLLDLTGEAEPRILHSYKQQPTCLAFSVNGKWAASASYDGSALVHETSTGKLAFEPVAKKGAILTACFAPDGKTLLAGEDGAVSFWDVQTGNLLRRVEGVSGQPFTLVFAPDGKTFAVGTSEGVIQVWDSVSGKQLRRIKAHADNVQALAFSPDGAALASGGSERGVRVWDTATGEQVNTLVGHQERVTAVAVAPGGKVVASAGWDQSILLWDPHTGKELRRFRWPSKETLPFGTSKAVDSLIFSPDGKLLAAIGYGGKVWLWDLEKGEIVRTFPGSCADFSPDGKHLATALWSTVARLYEIDTGKEVRQFKGHLSGISELKFTPDGRTLITASVGAPLGFRSAEETWDKQTIWLWDVETATVRMQFGGEHRTNSLALSPDGRTLTTTGLADNVVHLWELATGTQRAALHGHSENIFTTAFTPSGKLLASGSMDGTIRLWRMPEGKHVHAFEGHRGWVLTLAFAPDGARLVSGSLDTTGLIWKMPALPAPSPAMLTPGELEKLWQQLASADARVAQSAIARLAAAPEQTVSFLGEKVKPVAPPDGERTARWIAELDSANFGDRQKATAALENLGELAVAQLKAGLKKPAALETARRIELILAAIARQPLPAAKLRDVRAVEVLEHIATANALVNLRTLAKGAAAARLTREAHESLRRLEGDPAPKAPDR